MNNSMQSKNNSKVSVMPGMNTLKNEEGFVLVAALMILTILVIVGITATNTSNLEMQIAGNERFAKQAFYEADGGTEAGINVTFENALCLNTQDGFKDPGGGQPALIDGSIRVMNASLNFADPSRPPMPLPTDANRDAVFYTEGIIDDRSPHTNLTVNGVSEAVAGTSQAQVSGYLGLGYGAAAGGTDILYTINSQHSGVSNSQSLVSLGWRMNGLLINSASSFDCNY